MLHWILVYIYFSSLICSVSKAEQGRIRVLNNDESRIDFTNLLSSLVNVNEQRIKVINKLNNLQDYKPIRNSLRTESHRTIPGQKDRNLLIIVRSNSKSGPNSRRRVTDVAASYTYYDTDEQSIERHTRRTLVKHPHKSKLEPHVNYHTQDQGQSSTEEYSEPVREHRRINYRAQHDKVKKLTPKIRFKQTTSRFRTNGITAYDNKIDSLSDDFPLVTETSRGTIELPSNHHKSNLLQNTFKQGKKSTRNHGKVNSKTKRKTKLAPELPGTIIDDHDDQFTIMDTDYHSLDRYDSRIAGTIKKKDKKKRKLSQSMVHLPNFEIKYKPDSGIVKNEPHRFSVQPHYDMNDETITYTETPHIPKKYIQSTTHRTSTSPRPDVQDTSPPETAKIEDGHMKPNYMKPNEPKSFALKDLAALIQATSTTEKSNNDNQLPGMDMSKKYPINLNEIPNHVQHLTLKEIAAIANHALLKDSPRLTDSVKDLSVQRPSMPDRKKPDATDVLEIKKPGNSQESKHNYLRIEMGLNSKHSGDNQVYAEIGKGVSEYVLNIEDSNEDHDYEEPESEASKEFHITESGSAIDEINKFDETIPIDKLNLRKNWQKCIGKKAYKKCKKACFSSYKKVCRQLKCTSRSKKDLKRDCVKYCKSGFHKKKKNRSKDSRTSKSESSETE